MAVYYSTAAGFDLLEQVTAHGGHNDYGTAAAVGTVYLQPAGGPGALRLDSHGRLTGEWTPLGLTEDAAVRARARQLDHFRMVFGVGIDAMIPGKKLVTYRAPGATAQPQARLSVAPFATQSAGCEVAGALAGRPLLLFHGDRDELLPPEASHVVAAIAGHGEVEILPGDGHLLAKSDDVIVERLDTWLPEVLHL